MGLFKGIDFGLREGLGVRVDTKQDIANLRQQEEVKRKKEIDTETKAKLFGDDLKFGEAINRYDYEQLNTFTRDKLTELGNYVRAHPNYLSDVNQLGHVKRLKEDLVSNEHVFRAGRYEAELALYRKARSDIKTAYLYDGTDERKAIDKQIENYLNTGSTDGVAENKLEFKFTGSSKEVNVIKYLDKISKGVSANKSYRYKDDEGQTYQHAEVHYDDIAKLAESVFNDTKSIEGRATRAYLDSLVEKGVIEDGEQLQHLKDSMYNLRKKTSDYAVYGGGGGGGFGKKDEETYPSYYDGIYDDTKESKVEEKYFKHFFNYSKDGNRYNVKLNENPSIYLTDKDKAGKDKVNLDSLKVLNEIINTEGDSNFTMNSIDPKPINLGRSPEGAKMIGFKSNMAIEIVPKNKALIEELVKIGVLKDTSWNDWDDKYVVGGTDGGGYELGDDTKYGGVIENVPKKELENGTEIPATRYLNMNIVMQSTYNKDSARGHDNDMSGKGQGAKAKHTYEVVKKGEIYYKWLNDGKLEKTTDTADIKNSYKLQRGGKDGKIVYKVYNDGRPKEEVSASELIAFENQK